MDKVYTKKGDEGFTQDFGGNRIRKDDSLIRISGKIDFLQSALDRSILQSPENSEILFWIQKKLWQIAGELFNCPGDCLIDPIVEKDILQIENFTDQFGEPPKKFVRFDNEKSICFNECRVRCRELESYLSTLLHEGKLRKEIYQFINRLSSLFFMLAYVSSEITNR